MNWIKLYNRIPERVRIGVGGIVGAMLFVTSPHMIAAWCRYWS